MATKFMRDGNPYFLYSGEIHYWRLDPKDWADRLRIARETGLNTVSTYVPWRIHEPEEGRIDLAMLDDYIAAVAAAHLSLFIRVGPVANAELVNEGLPAWLAADARTRPQSAPGETPAWCGPSYMAPRFLEATSKWYDALLPRVARLQATKNGPIVAVQLCNEIAMIPWICRYADRSPHVEAMYRAWLRERYGRIEAMREAYEEPSLPSFDEVQQPANRADGPNLRKHLDRARFYRSYYAAYYASLAAMAKRHGIEVPLIANIPMFWDYDTRGRGHQAPLTVSIFSRFADAVPGVSLGGAYQMRRLDHENSHDIAIATEASRMATVPEDRTKPAGAVLCVELQTGVLCDRPLVYPPDIDLNIRISAGHGLAGVNAYMFCGGRNAPGQGAFGTHHEWQSPVAADGTLRPHIAPMADFGRFLEGFGDAFAASEKVFATSVGFYQPYWMTELIEGTEANSLQQLREAYCFDGLWRQLDLSGRPYRFEDLESAHAIASDSLFVFSLDRMGLEAQEKLARYVENGGRLFLGPRVPSRDWRGKPCTVLAEALGLSTKTKPCELVRLDGEDLYVCREIDVVAERPGDDVLARYTGGGAAAVLRNVGKGSLLFAGFFLEDKFLYWRPILSAWFEKLGVAEAVRIRPHGEIGAQLRTGASGSFLVVSNQHDVAVKASVAVPSRGLDLALELPARGAWVLPVDAALVGGARLARANAEVWSAAKRDGAWALTFRAPALGGTFEAEIVEADGRRVRVTGPAGAGRASAKED